MAAVLVLEDGRGGGVVESARASGVRSGSHEEGGVGEVVAFGAEEDVGGLARGDENRGGSEWLDVDRVGFHHGERVVGYAEEELIVECGVDEPEEVCLPGLHFQLEGICKKSTYIYIYLSTFGYHLMCRLL